MTNVVSGTAKQAPAATVLGQFIASTRYQDLPKEVQVGAKMRVLNTIAATYAGEETPASQLALSFARSRTGSGPATYWLTGGKGSLQDCVFANGILSHSALLNDMMGGHMGCAVPPAALAVAEENNSSGQDMLAAIVFGYEVAGRIDAAGYLTSANTKRGIRLSSATWELGPSVTAAYLMGLTASGITDALAITAGALCSAGTYEVIGRHGTTERFIQLGAGVRSGVFAAELARSGFTGTDTGLEGPSGFYFVWTGKADAPPELLGGLGKKWYILDAILKPYGAGATNNFVIFAAERLVHDEQVKFDDITDIEVRTTDWKHMHGVVDPGPFDDFEQAHVSCPFAVAVTLVFGTYDVNGILKGIHDERVNSLAQRIKVSVGEPGAAHHLGGNRLTSKYGEVSVTLRNGKSLTGNALGMPDSMIKPAWPQMVERFHRLTKDALSAEKREMIVNEVDQLDKRSDCSALIALMKKSK